MRIIAPATDHERAIARTAYMQALLERGCDPSRASDQAIASYPDPLTYSRIMRSSSGWLVRRRSDGVWEKATVPAGPWETSLLLTDDGVKALAGCLP